MHINEKTDTRGYWNKKQQKEHASFSEMCRIHHKKSCEVRQKKQFFPTSVWSPTFRVQLTIGRNCYWWLASCATASFAGELRSSWILCISSFVFWDVDMSLRSPIKSSVICSRAFLGRKTHKPQFKLLVIISQNLWNTQNVKMIRFYKGLTILQVGAHAVSSALPFYALSQTFHPVTECPWSKRQWEAWAQVHFRIEIITFKLTPRSRRLFSLGVITCSCEPDFSTPTCVTIKSF